MDVDLEIWAESRLPNRVTLKSDRAAIGRSSSNEIALDFDAAVSRLHAVVERYPAGWCVRDVGSANGTLNGERLEGERLLRNGDEIRVGGTRLIFKARETEPQIAGTLHIEESPPELTRRERDVLIALCRPLSTGSEAFAQPATTSQIAAELVVSDAAVKFHLGNLYHKFAISESGQGRCAQLSNEALKRGAVSQADLRSTVADRPQAAR
jgi:pSer/pThr/pTyr-binding forkhead associated (FHA) protein